MKLLRPIAIRRDIDSSFQDEPVSVSEAKQQLRIDSSITEDDSYIQQLITSARQEAEKATRRALAPNQTWRFSYERFPVSVVYESLLIPVPPLVSVDSVNYIGVNDGNNSLSSNKFSIEQNSDHFALINFVDTFSIPTISQRRETPVSVIANVGGEPTYALKQAILILVAHFYEQRVPVSIGSMPFKLPRSVDTIFAQNRIPRI